MADRPRRTESPLQQRASVAAAPPACIGSTPTPSTRSSGNGSLARQALTGSADRLRQPPAHRARSPRPFSAAGIVGYALDPDTSAPIRRCATVSTTRPPFSSLPTAPIPARSSITASPFRPAAKLPAGDHTVTVEAVDPVSDQLVQLASQPIYRPRSDRRHAAHRHHHDATTTQVAGTVSGPGLRRRHWQGADRHRRRGRQTGPRRPRPPPPDTYSFGQAPETPLPARARRRTSTCSDPTRRDPPVLHRAPTCRNTPRVSRNPRPPQSRARSPVHITSRTGTAFVRLDIDGLIGGLIHVRKVGQRRDAIRRPRSPTGSSPPGAEPDRSDHARHARRFSTTASPTRNPRPLLVRLVLDFRPLIKIQVELPSCRARPSTSRCRENSKTQAGAEKVAAFSSCTFACRTSFSSSRDSPVRRRRFDQLLPHRRNVGPFAGDFAKTMQGARLLPASRKQSESTDHFAVALGNPKVPVPAIEVDWFNWNRWSRNRSTKRPHAPAR